MREIVFHCSCGRKTTFGPKCAWCSKESDAEEPTIDWEELKDYVDCEKFKEEED